MGKLNSMDQQKQAGFTLVELAIVMIIIGLLIGGVLKGQELITNAQVAATVSQVKGVDAGVSTFRDSYKAIPGDMSTAESRLANCGTNNCLNGDGNGRLDGTPNAATQSGERLYFWAHLNAADLIAGVQNDPTVAWGQALPSAPIGGGMTVGYLQSGTLINQTGANNARGGMYLVLRAAPDASAAGTNGDVTTSQAARIDRKMDDGQPNSGTVMAIGNANGTGNGNCASGSADTDIYNEATAAKDCSLAFRIQQ